MASPSTPARTCTPPAVSSTSSSPVSPPSRATPRWPSPISTCGRFPSDPPRWRPTSPSPWTASSSSRWPRAARTATRTPPICAPTCRRPPGACPWPHRPPTPGPRPPRSWPRRPLSRFSPPPPSPRCPPGPLRCRRPRRPRSPRRSPRATPGSGSSCSCCSWPWPSSPGCGPPEPSTLIRPRRRVRPSARWMSPTSPARTRTRPRRPSRTPA